tara:strand:+ start:134 stop:433 length:300 start_codon:yes stop_codon:yes gene_type:complete
MTILKSVNESELYLVEVCLDSFNNNYHSKRNEIDSLKGKLSKQIKHYLDDDYDENALTDITLTKKEISLILLCMEKYDANFYDKRNEILSLEEKIFKNI